MNIAASVLLSSAVFGAAVLYAGRLRKRTLALKELRDFFEGLGKHSVCFSGDSLALINRAESSGVVFASETIKNLRQNADIRTAWETAAYEFDSGRYLTADERGYLLRCSELFQSVSEADFLKMCSAAADFFSGELKKSEQEEARRRRLALSFGALGAALIIIVTV